MLNSVRNLKKTKARKWVRLWMRLDPVDSKNGIRFTPSLVCFINSYEGDEGGEGL